MTIKDTKKNKFCLWLYEFCQSLGLWFVARDSNRVYSWFSVFPFSLGEWALLRCDLEPRPMTQSPNQKVIEE